MNDDLTLKVSEYQSVKNFSCSSPTVIFNRASLFGMVRSGVFKNGECILSPTLCRHYFNVGTLTTMFLPFNYGVCFYRGNKYCIDEVALNSYYTYDHGERVFIFMLCKCGKCDVCRASRYTELVCRLNYEADCHDSLPLFVTLTYRDDFLPTEGVVKRDVQLFIKRLRHLFDTKIRYFVVSEYGKKRGRPHYHLLLFGIPFLENQNDLNRVTNLICKSWRLPNHDTSMYDKPIYHGGASIFYKYQFGQVRVDVCHDRRQLSYVAKYLLKPQVQTNYPNDCFFLRSSGLGRDIIIKHSLIDSFRRSPDCSLCYRSDLFDDIYKFVPSSYFLRKMCPTYSQMVSSSLRNLFDSFNFIFRRLASFGYSPTKLVEYVLPFYEKYKNFGFARPCDYSVSETARKSLQMRFYSRYRKFSVEKHSVIAYGGTLSPVRECLEDYVTLMTRLKLEDSKLDITHLERSIVDNNNIRKRYFLSLYRKSVSLSELQARSIIRSCSSLGYKDEQ